MSSTISSRFEAALPNRITRTLLWLGMIGPIAIIGLGLLAVGIAPKHELMSDTFSDLAGQDAPNSDVMRTSMIAFGASITLFGIGLVRVNFQTHRLAGTLIPLFGIAVAFSGWFRDHSEKPGVSHNIEGNLHNGFAIAAICLIMLAMIQELFRRWDSNQKERPWWSSLTQLVVVSGGGAVFAFGPSDFGGGAEIVVYVAILSFLVGTARSALIDFYARNETTGYRSGLRSGISQN